MEGYGLWGRSRWSTWCYASGIELQKLTVLPLFLNCYSRALFGCNKLVYYCRVCHKECDDISDFSRSSPQVKAGLTFLKTFLSW
ncbi:hypothetical protein AGIG_G10066 [Arapaima gigas]